MLSLTIVVVILSIFIIFYNKKCRWKNLPCLGPQIPYGSLILSVKLKENLAVTFRKIYEDMKRRKWKHGGIYFLASPTYFVVDLEYIKTILKTDFQHFFDRGVYYNEPLNAHLFNIGGSKWKKLRTKLTPTFTSAKLKSMFQCLIECEAKLQERMKIEYSKNEAINMKKLLESFTIDVIGSSAFGLDLTNFEDENSPFKVNGRKIFAINKLLLLKILFCNSFPEFAKKLGVRLLSEEVTIFYEKMVKDVVTYRESNNYIRKDFIQMLINLKNSEEEESRLTIEEITAQCFLFFLASFETSSTTMAYAMYELAKNPEIQEKVRQEISAVLSKHEGKITYESLQEMKYLHQVIEETLRKHPPIPFITRKCVKDYKICDSNVTIKKDTMVIISLLGVHYDEEYYSKPEEFIPERFCEENKSLRHNFAHIPFGKGPRMCIGIRFGLMQTKVALTSLLRDYKFVVNIKTKEPLEIQVGPFFLAPEGGIWLDAVKIN